MSNENRPSILKVGKGGKIGKLDMNDNTIIGDVDLVNNEGEIESATLNRNRHILTPKLNKLLQAVKKPTANNHEGWKIMIVGVVLTAIATLVCAVSYDFYIKPTYTKITQEPDKKVEPKKLK